MIRQTLKGCWADVRPSRTGSTQSAGELGLSQDQLDGRIRTGRRRVRRDEDLLVIAEALEVPPASLVREQPRPAPAAVGLGYGQGVISAAGGARELIHGAPQPGAWMGPGAGTPDCLAGGPPVGRGWPGPMKRPTGADWSPARSARSRTRGSSAIRGTTGSLGMPILPCSTCFTHEGDMPSRPAATGRLSPRRVRRICIRGPKAIGSVYGSGWHRPAGPCPSLPSSSLPGYGARPFPCAPRYLRP